MESHLLQGDVDLQRIRSLVQRLPGGTSVVDFEEKLVTPAVRRYTRLWLEGDRAIAFALVDEFNNLAFDADPVFLSQALGQEIVAWGLACMRQRNAETGETAMLDASCEADDSGRIAFLEGFGFQREDIRSLQYIRSLDEPIQARPLPAGISLRAVLGEQEVEELVALHRSAFGTNNMTVSGRLAIMHAPNYVPELDWLAVAPSGELAAFCICGFEDDSHQTGYTDPIGTHPRYQKLGLGRALVSAGLQELQRRGAKTARLGTSSENKAMQQLAEALGFRIVSERVWFSRLVN